MQRFHQISDEKSQSLCFRYESIQTLIYSNSIKFISMLIDLCKSLKNDITDCYTVEHGPRNALVIYQISKFI